MLPRTAGKWTMLVGLSLVTLTFLGTVNYLFPFYPHTYFFAWYGLILFLEGLLWWRWSDGLIFQRPAQFVTLLFWSAVFWFFFELWNLRLQNWYYVGVPPKGPWSHVEAYLDFATVLPGMFLVYRLLHRLGIPRRIHTRFGLPAGWRRYWTALGLGMVVLPLFYPDLFFPCVWAAFIFLLEPVCASLKGPSLLRDAQNGEWTTLVRLLCAGILCGGYWELCNYWSLEKWIYTVPFFSQGKLFEMPYLGFLGFPPFCVQCFVMTNAVFLVRGGRHWHPDVLEAATPSRIRRISYAAMIAIGLLLSEYSFSQMQRHTIDSRAESVEQITGDISPDDARRLGIQGWRYPEKVLKNWAEAAPLIAPAFRERIRQRLELAGHLHMGSDNAGLLESVGVLSPDALGRQDPDRLFAQLVAANQRIKLRDTPLVKRRVIAWIEGTRRTSALY
jgi:hypothetical protein